MNQAPFVPSPSFCRADFVMQPSHFQATRRSRRHAGLQNPANCRAILQALAENLSKFGSWVNFARDSDRSLQAQKGSNRPHFVTLL
jgi:hypothetical protein